MTKRIISAKTYQTLLDKKERELLTNQQILLSSLESDYTIKDILTLQSTVRTLDKTVNKLIISIIKTKQRQEISNATEYEELRKRASELKHITREMAKVLSDELSQQQRGQEKRSIDVVKTVGFIFALPVFIVNASKNTIDPNGTHSTFWSGFGVSLGIGCAYYKQIVSGMRAASKTLRDAPRKIKNSFMLYYVKESLKERGQSILGATKHRPKENTPKIPQPKKDLFL